MRGEHVIAPLLALWAALRARTVHWEVAVPVLALGISLIAVIGSSFLSLTTGLMADPLIYFIRLVTPMLLIMGMPSALAIVQNPTLGAAKIIVILATGVAMLTLAGTYVPAVMDVITLWVRTEEGSTWMISQDVGRNSGIFNQPLEAGLFYSVALFSFVHVWRWSGWSRWLMTLCLVGILVGGVLTLSKNFLLLGIGLAIVYSLMIGALSGRVAILIGIPLVIFAPAATYQINANYFDSLDRLYRDGGWLAAISAGRFGLDESDVAGLFQELWRSGDWLRGRGLGSHLPLDNGYLEFFYQGGIVALIGYLVSLSSLTIYALAHRARTEGQLLLIILVYTWLASLGGPVISAGRANVALLLLVSACLADLRRRPTTYADVDDRSVPHSQHLHLDGLAASRQGLPHLPR